MQEVTTIENVSISAEWENDKLILIFKNCGQNTKKNRHSMSESQRTRYKVIAVFSVTPRRFRDRAFARRI